MWSYRCCVLSCYVASRRTWKRNCCPRRRPRSSLASARCRENCEWPLNSVSTNSVIRVRIWGGGGGKKSFLIWRNFLNPVFHFWPPPSSCFVSFLTKEPFKEEHPRHEKTWSFVMVICDGFIYMGVWRKSSQKLVPAVSSHVLSPQSSCFEQSHKLEHLNMTQTQRKEESVLYKQSASLNGVLKKMWCLLGSFCLVVFFLQKSVGDMEVHVYMHVHQSEWMKLLLVSCIGYDLKWGWCFLRTTS